MIENLSINEFSQLPNRMKHALTEEIFGDKIKLTYEKAIGVINSCLESYEILATSYANFNIFCNESQLNLTDNLDILVNVSIEKFNQELCFTIKNKQNFFSHYVFNVPDSKFTLINDKMKLAYYDSTGKAVCSSSSSYSGIDAISFKLKFESCFSKTLQSNIKGLWTKELIHYVYNTPPDNNILILNGISDNNRVMHLRKKFKPIAFNMIKFNKEVFNISSPACACIEPDDLITHFSTVKNALSKI